MAFNFVDSASGGISLADNAALTLPDGDWTIGGWLKLDHNTGSLYQYFLSWGTLGADPAINWYFQEHTSAAPDTLKALINDSGGDEFLCLSAGTPGTSRVWQHIMLQRSGTVCTQYINNAADGSEDDAGVGVIDVAALLYFGIREDDNADRRFDGKLAEWAKWDRALTAGERLALVNRFSPLFFLKDMKWYAPMVRSYHELVNSIAITNTASSVTDHPKIIYPSGLWIPHKAVAAGVVPQLQMLRQIWAA